MPTPKVAGSGALAESSEYALGYVLAEFDAFSKCNTTTDLQLGELQSIALSRVLNMLPGKGLWKKATGCCDDVDKRVTASDVEQQKPLELLCAQP